MDVFGRLEAAALSQLEAVFAFSIVTEAALSFLGAGAAADQPDLGQHAAWLILALGLRRGSSFRPESL